MRNYLENIRRMVIRKIWVKAMTAAIALAAALNACSSDDNGSDGGSSCSINGSTVQIGSQTWMAENLNCNVSGSKCYDNNSSNCSKYGRLYTWEQAKSACPTDWHLPSDKEWKTLMDSTASDTVKTPVPVDTIKVTGKKDSIVYDTIVSFIFGKASAKKMRTKSGWSRGGNGTDDYGFSVLPSGYGYSGDYFYHAGYSSYSWSSRESDSIYAYVLYYNHEDDVIMSDNGNKKYYFSVRCVQD